MIEHISSSDIFGNLDILHKYFNNLECINLMTNADLSIHEIGKIFNNRKIHLNKLERSSNNSDCSIASKVGCVVLYDGQDHFYINFKTFRLYFYSDNYTTQGDYVIFYYNHKSMELKDGEVTEYSQKYDSLNFELIDRPSIIVHKKYIYELYIENCLENSLDIEPTQSLNLFISNANKNNQKAILEYLNTHSFDKLFTEVTIYG